MSINSRNPGPVHMRVADVAGNICQALLTARQSRRSAAVASRAVVFASDRRAPRRCQSHRSAGNASASPSMDCSIDDRRASILVDGARGRRLVPRASSGGGDSSPPEPSSSSSSSSTLINSLDGVLGTTPEATDAEPNDEPPPPPPPPQPEPTRAKTPPPRLQATPGSGGA